jgi:hypothetical protein
LHEPDSQSQVPRARDLLLIAAFAVALRVAVFAAVIAPGRVTLRQYTSKGDTVSYIAVASAMSGERSYASLGEYDRRVFPGYPALIALVHLVRVPLPIAALCMTWLCAGVAAAAGARAFGDPRVGWALTCLVPHYLINSSLGMSEAPLLAFVCTGFLLARSDRLIAGGIAFGLAGLIRPMACFALAGAVYMILRDSATLRLRGEKFCRDSQRDRWIGALKICVAAAMTFAAGFAAMQVWTGNALQGVHVYANHPGAYAGHLIVWPFESLVMGTIHASHWRIIYIWLHVVVVLIAVGLAGWKSLSKHDADPRDSASFPWLFCNTAMVLCLGPPWGFSHFPRFSIPAEPAIFWTLRNVLPRNRWIWLAIGGVVFVFAVLGVIDSP